MASLEKLAFNAAAGQGRSALYAPGMGDQSLASDRQEDSEEV